MTYTPTNVIQYNEYYPFGLQTANSWTRDNNKNDFLYNEGSEMNTTSGFYDLPFRNYDAALGRFFQVDPLSAQDHSITPFAYAGNNPIVNNDPSGLMTDYSTCWCNPDYAYARQVDAENRAMLANSSWSDNGRGSGGGHWSDKIGSNPYSDAQKVRDGLMYVGDYVAKYGSAVNISGIPGDASLADVAAGISAAMNGGSGVGGNQNSGGSRGFLFSYSTTPTSLNPSERKSVFVSIGKAQLDGAKFFDNYKETVDYIRSVTRDGIVVGLGLEGGGYIVLPTEGMRYKGRREAGVTKNTRTYFSLNMLRNRGTGQNYQVKFNGKWNKIDHFILSIPSIYDFYRRDSTPDKNGRYGYHWVLPPDEFLELGPRIGADHLILLIDTQLGPHESLYHMHK